MIARAILKNPRVFLLDEATSGLDDQLEKLAQVAVERVMVGRTSVVVAHRLSSIQNCDTVVVLDKGGIKADTLYLVNTKEVIFVLEWLLHLILKKVSCQQDLPVSMDIFTVGGKLECTITSWLETTSYGILYWMDRLF